MDVARCGVVRLVENVLGWSNTYLVEVLAADWHHRFSLGQFSPEVSTFLLVHDEHEKLIEWLDFMLRLVYPWAWCMFAIAFCENEFVPTWWRQVPQLVGIVIPSTLPFEWHRPTTTCLAMLHGIFQVAFLCLVHLIVSCDRDIHRKNMTIEFAVICSVNPFCLQ